MAAHEFDAAEFRALFPAFSDQTKYPDDVLSGYFSVATFYLNPEDNCVINGARLQMGLNMCTAHIAQLFTTIGTDASEGASSGVVTGSSVEKVSVQLAIPPTTSGWQFWLASTPYGNMLWQLLRTISAGGFAVGMLPETKGFRKVGGVF